MSNLNVKYLEIFMNHYQEEGEYGRTHAYDLFHNKFKGALQIEKPAPEIYDDLACHLYAFLGNWGMLRGRGFLLQLNYKSIIPIIEIVSEPKYRWLLDIDITKLPVEEEEKYCNDILDLKKHISNTFKEVQCYKFDLKKKEYVRKKINVSDTFVGEVLMGTLGCYISCDDYTRECLKEYSIPKTFNKEQIAGLIKLIKSNVETFTHYADLKKSINTGCDYSVMKLLDITLWQEGIIKYARPN